MEISGCSQLWAGDRNTSIWEGLGMEGADTQDVGMVAGRPEEGKEAVGREVVGLETSDI